MEFIKLSIRSKDIQKQEAFYRGNLGLPTHWLSENEFEVKIGKSTINLKKNLEATPYHLAINIPCNKAKEALSWLKERVPILKFKQDEIIDFSAWNAKSIYFYDEDFNILELIARKNLSNEIKQPFTQDHFLELSEIGVLTKSINQSYQQLNQQFRLPIYDGKMDHFCAVGTDQALFILIDLKKGTWFPADDKAFPSDFELVLRLNEKEKSIAFDGEKFQFDH